MRVYNGTFHNICPKHLNIFVNEILFKLSGGNHQIDIKSRIVSLLN